MKFIPIVMAILLAFGIVLPATAAVTPTTIDGATIVDPAAAKALLDKGAKFIDVRGLSEWKRGRIPGPSRSTYSTDSVKTAWAK